MAACIALLRGINVGRAKRVAMADLRTLIEELGYTKLRTLLNSGNAVFQAAYLWCPDGIIESRLAQAFARLAGEAATTRNWSTVLKLQSLADGDQSTT